ncbi:EexN family lipoprotein [Pseudorhodoferax sp.]|uniref:EexN family lipoprotein n=1 Tax=Pseudorhodoferax sp. TaxID=1993553 RepID=UPI002DD64CE2|nr:EexN family lipoprotein [Pseudorhodoferax sp.]
MNRILFALAMGSALLLAACGKLEPVQSIESVESLVANPDRLKELRAQCKADHAKVGDAQCNAVAEATRQRFMRAAPSPYASDPVRSPPPPASTPAAKDGPP